MTPADLPGEERLLLLVSDRFDRALMGATGRTYAVPRISRSARRIIYAQRWLMHESARHDG